MSFNLKYDKLLVVDLEATCDDKDPNFKRVSDIIEFGWVLGNIRSGQIEDCGTWLVRPVRSGITEFCTQLTTITDEMIQQDGVSWETVVAEAQAKKLDGYPWASWGDYDKNMIAETVKRHRTKSPVSVRHINLKLLHALQMWNTKEVGITAAMKQMNIPMEGTLHRGIDDAKNIWKIASKLFVN